MDIIIEISIEIYLELMLLIIPEKNLTKKYKIIAKVIALVMTFILLGLIIFGLILIIDNNNLLGIIPLAFGIIISLVQIVFGIILYKKHH